MGRPGRWGGCGWLIYVWINITMARGLYVFGVAKSPLAADAQEESTGVVISIPEGATEPVVKPLPPKEKP